MTKGYIDGATITSALTFLNLGRNATRPAWHQQSVLEATYLMLHDDIHIIPRPKGTGGELGDYAIVAQGFRELIVDVDRRKEVLKSTFANADQYHDAIKSAWDRSQADDDFQTWADLQRHDRWINQVLTYGGLFDAESVDMISKVSGYKRPSVERILKESANPANVSRWKKLIDASEDAKIANAGWVIGGFLRGIFYENLAASQSLHLLPHPFRSTLHTPLETSERHDVTNSEEVLVKILIANALTERTKARRIQTWTQTVRSTRDFINREHPPLPRATQVEAEEYAIQVARKLNLQGGPRYLRRLIDITIPLAFNLAGFSVAPWIALGIYAYWELTNKTPGEYIGDALLKSDYQFRWLARSIPGRIERTLPTSK